MIRPPSAQSAETFRRVFQETKSIEAAADAVAAAAVEYSKVGLGIGSRAARGALTNIPRHTLPRLVLRTVCEARGVSEELVLSLDKRRFVSHTRWEIEYILVEEASFTDREIAAELNLAHHHSVEHGRNAVKEKIAHVVGYADQVKGLVQRVVDASRRSAA